MATAVFFHAHPDDEAISTGGTMALLAAAGHRVVLVTATRGELGEVPDGYLRPGEALAERREVELDAACAELGVARHEYLGYGDSGMAGEDTNDRPGSFWSADVEEAAERLAGILRAEGADILTAYDENGGYGHPDHIQVHRVGLRAGVLGAVPRVFMATINRDHLLALRETDEGAAFMDRPEQAPPVDALGVAGDRITTAVDVHAFLDCKRRAMAAHGSQISETSFFLSMPPEAFAAVWGTEWFMRVGAEPGGPVEHSLLAEAGA
ncbi:MAG: PIG-L family deacetylase [Acidimicrobiales bacterium]